MSRVRCKVTLTHQERQMLQEVSSKPIGYRFNEKNYGLMASAPRTATISKTRRVRKSPLPPPPAPSMHYTERGNGDRTAAALVPGLIG